MSMSVSIVSAPPYQQNCSMRIGERSGRAAIVDPTGDLAPNVAAARYD
ncbi:MAG: hypothetical protein ACI87W_001063 [Halieaceae bacterium]|jgi:hypothetical protein